MEYGVPSWNEAANTGDLVLEGNGGGFQARDRRFRSSVTEGQTASYGRRVPTVV